MLKNNGNAEEKFQTFSARIDLLSSSSSSTFSFSHSDELAFLLARELSSSYGMSLNLSTGFSPQHRSHCLTPRLKLLSSHLINKSLSFSVILAQLSK
jgi:hypothetical protein